MNPRKPELRDLSPETADLKSRPFGQSRVPPPNNNALLKPKKDITQTHLHNEILAS